MPESLTARWPHVSLGVESCKSVVDAARFNVSMAQNAAASWADWVQLGAHLGARMTHSLFPERRSGLMRSSAATLDLWQNGAAWWLNQALGTTQSGLNRLDREWKADAALCELFSATLAPQEWSVDDDDRRVLLDLPSLRAIDISTIDDHRIRNYTVVFAPRAGHHSNIAERVACHLRDNGLSRLVVVEQKCADEIPLAVDGKRHGEGFQSQVDQYAAVLEHFYRQSGVPSHLVAVCQPGPLLMATLAIHPHLGRTFGSAGSPMHTEAQRGVLTDFSRFVGPGFIDMMLAAFGRRVNRERPGAGRPVFDGSLQILGFYLLGAKHHLQNFRQLRMDVVEGNEDGARRQRSFYQWYNTVHHFPAGFIRDTFKQVFVKNALVRGRLQVGDRVLGLADYPAGVPIWAIGGTRDDIVPPMQATGHMALLDQVPEDKKRIMHCQAGHMGLFRSRRVLNEHYSAVARFLLDHSDMA